VACSQPLFTRADATGIWELHHWRGLSSTTGEQCQGLTCGGFRVHEGADDTRTPSRLPTYTRCVDSRVRPQRVRFARTETCWICSTCGQHLTADSFPTTNDKNIPPEDRPRWSECRVCEELGTPRQGNHSRKPCKDPACHRGSPLTDSVTARDVDTKPEEDEDEIDTVHHEGVVKYRIHRVLERDRKLRKRKLDDLRREPSGIRCQACELVIEDVYGTPEGQVYECHHLLPLHATGERITTLEDVVLLCPTCHRAAHRTRPWPTLAEMRTRHLT